MLARQLLAWTGIQVEGLYPGCFAIVMATGIISNALFVEGPRLLSDAFLLANVVAYPLLAVLTGVRAARFTHAFWSDLSSRGIVFSFFTIIAASSVFGEGLFLRSVSSIALCLWLFALAAWIALIYLSFSVMTFSKAKLHTAIIQDGSLLAIVVPFRSRHDDRTRNRRLSPPRFTRSLICYGASALLSTRYILCS